MALYSNSLSAIVVGPDLGIVTQLQQPCQAPSSSETALSVVASEARKTGSFWFRSFVLSGKRSRHVHLFWGVCVFGAPLPNPCSTVLDFSLCKPPTCL